jgi:hypothetical protein
MPELPDHPDIDQLRRQARELHRAASAGESDAVARVRAVSDRTALSSAQLAIAREYGYSSWPALRTEVDRRRAMRPAAKPARPVAWLDQRYSFGGGAAIQTAEGVLTPEVLIAGPGHAELHASGVLNPEVSSGRFGRLSRRRPSFDDLTATDDSGARYTLSFSSGSLHHARSGEAPGRSEVDLRVDPVPPADAAWLEVQVQNGPAARLVRSPRAAVRVGDVGVVSAREAAERKLTGLAYFLLDLRHSVPHSDLSRQRTNALAKSAEIQESGVLGAGSELPAQLARLCGCLTEGLLAADLPPEWQRFVEAANQADGPERHLDIATALPRIGGVAIQLDHLVSEPASWALYLRALPGWWGYSDDGQRKWELVSVWAQDDQGGRYQSTFGGSTGHSDHEDLRLAFQPRMSPLARRLRLSFGTDAVEAHAELDLVSA